MTHTLNVIPVHLIVAGSVLKCQFIYRFANNFHVFHQPKVYHRVRLRFFQGVVFHVIGKHICCFKNVL